MVAAQNRLEKIYKNYLSKMEAVYTRLTSRQGGAKEASATAKAPKTPKVKKEGLNRSQLIRDYFEKHGIDSRPKDVIVALKEQHSIEVAPALVSIIKGKLSTTKAPKAKKAPKVKAAKVKATKEKVAKAPKTEVKESKLPLPALCEKILSSSREGYKLGDVAELVAKAGYEYTGEKGHKGLVQNVYQALYNLCREKKHPGYEGETAVVIHDETSKRYRINPKAKKKTAA